MASDPSDILIVTTESIHGRTCIPFAPILVACCFSKSLVGDMTANVKNWTTGGELRGYSGHVGAGRSDGAAAYGREGCCAGDRRGGRDATCHLGRGGGGSGVDRLWHGGALCGIAFVVPRSNFGPTRHVQATRICSRSENIVPSGAASTRQLEFETGERRLFDMTP